MKKLFIIIMGISVLFATDVTSNTGLTMPKDVKKLKRQDTKTKRYYKDGSIKSEVIYNKDKSGVLKLYYPNGVVHNIINFNPNRLPNGVSKDYSRENKLIFETNYKDGKLIDSYCYDSKNKKRKLTHKEIAKPLGYPVDCDKKPKGK